MIDKWDERFLQLAKHAASWSKDPSTQVGAVVVRRDRTVASMGFNGFPWGVEDSQERLEDRDTKYKLVVHAEANALLFAREPLFNCSLFCTLQPCSTCTGLIIQSGIARVVAARPTEEQQERWGADMELAERMFTEAGVELVLV